MSRTHPTTLVLFALAGVVLGYLGDLAIVAAGASALVPPLSLAITLVLVGVIVVVLAWPVRRVVRSTEKRHLDPFHATRVAVLAKASSVVGALVTGLSAGIVIFLLTRTVLATPDTVWLAVASAIGALLLVVGALVAESFCKLPPDDPDEESTANV